MVWLLPVYVPLLLAVPLAVVTGNVGLGQQLRSWGLLLTPEETLAPALLRAAWGHARRYAVPVMAPAMAYHQHADGIDAVSQTGALTAAPA